MDEHRVVTGLPTAKATVRSNRVSQCQATSDHRRNWLVIHAMRVLVLARPLTWHPHHDYKARVQKDPRLECPTRDCWEWFGKEPPLAENVTSSCGGPVHMCKHSLWTTYDWKW